MDYLGLSYLAIFSFAWLFGLKEHIEFKAHKYFIFLSILSGILIIISVVLTWPANISPEIKKIWKYILIFLIVTEIMITKYELKLLPERLKEKDDIELQMDNFTIGFSLFIGTILIAPGLYYAYKVAFL
jgi:hypothetical protein